MGRIRESMPKGKAYGPLNEVDKGARSAKQTTNSKEPPVIQPRPSKAVNKLRSDDSIEKKTASTGAPQKLKSVKFEKGVNRKDARPDSDTTGSNESKRDGVSTGEGEERDRSLKPTPAQQSALFGGHSYGQALGYVPKSFWSKGARDLIKPDNTAVDQAAAIYYMK